MVTTLTASPYYWGYCWATVAFLHVGAIFSVFTAPTFIGWQFLLLSYRLRLVERVWLLGRPIWKSLAYLHQTALNIPFDLILLHHFW
jgi:hypothetical protein